MFLSPEILLKAYAKGIFPMSDSFDDPFVYWVDPQIRGIIELNEFKITKSLKKTLKKKKHVIKINTNFERIIELCAKNVNREKTWINKQIISNYIKLFKIGKAKSVECYFNNKLAGGLYGITIGNIFCGESMFSIEKDASKITLAYLAARLMEGGFEFIDTQFYSSHLKQFRTKQSIRSDFHKLLLKNKKEIREFPEKISKDILKYF